MNEIRKALETYLKESEANYDKTEREYKREDLNDIYRNDLLNQANIMQTRVNFCRFMLDLIDELSTSRNSSLLLQMKKMRFLIGLEVIKEMVE